jgi:hypothetical protein
MKRLRLRDATPCRQERNDGALARENARLRGLLTEAERELSCCERAAWAGGRSALEPHMKNALSIIRTGLDR